MRDAALTTVAAALVVGCGQPIDPSDRSLLPVQTPLHDTSEFAGDKRRAGDRRLSAGQQPRRHLRVGQSDREAVLTQSGSGWEALVRFDGDARLEFAVAAVGASEQPRNAWVELVDGDARREVSRVSIDPSDGWQTHQKELHLPDHGEAKLVFLSSGPGEVAWAETYITKPNPSIAPNIVLIIIDTLRSDHLSCYGYPRNTSPNLDRLAAESMLFLNSFSSSTWTLPSVATLLSGLLPDQHGVRSIKGGMPKKVTSVAERLKAAGYRTAAFTDGGFLDPRWGFGQGFDRYDSTGGAAWEPKDVAVIEAGSSAWLRENQFEPFFLLVHTYETHQPYTFREGFSERFLAGDQEGPLPESIESWDLARNPDSEETLHQVLTLYDGEIARTDHYVGRLIDTLRESNQFDNTAVLVTSDHGEEFLEHGGVEHGTGKVFDENLRVPLIVKLPRGGAGQKFKVQVSGIDVPPTILQLASVEAPRDLPGRSVVSRAVTEQKSRRVFAHGLNSFPELNEERYRLDNGRRSVIFDRVRDRRSFFNLELDPEMRRPRSAKKDAGEGELIVRIQAMLALSQGGGAYFVSLPEVAAGLKVPKKSGVKPVVLWDGLDRKEIGKGTICQLRSHLPHILVFEVASPAVPLLIEIQRSSWLPFEVVEILPMDPQQAPLANDLLHGDLPPILRMMATSQGHSAQAIEIDETVAEELRALGYLE